MQSWINPGEVPFEDSEIEPQMTVGFYDLLLAFRDVVKRAEERPMMDVDREEFSIEQMMGYLFEKIVAATRRRHVDRGPAGSHQPARI